MPHRLGFSVRTWLDDLTDFHRARKQTPTNTPKRAPTYDEMFVRTGHNLPGDPQYPVKLEDLGYEINAQGQIVCINPPHSFYSFYVTDSERANEVHKEAMHSCVREAVKAELEKLGVKQVYCTGDDGTELEEEKPMAGEANIPIMMTEPSVLKTKRDVVVVIGEHTQDVAVWAWRLAMRDGGIEDGAAVGLVRKLMQLDFDGLPSRDATEFAARKATRNDSVATVRDTSATPGLILLNPGQVLYSPGLNKSMTQATWMARPKADALTYPFTIDQMYNRVPGHNTPYEHVETVLDHILPQVLGEMSNVRLWIVGISDGAENFIHYMDLKLANQHKSLIGRAVSGVAFMEPTHDASKLQSEAMKVFLHAAGKCWIKSSKKMGTWVNAPGAMKKIVHPSEKNDDEDDEEALPKVKHVKIDEAVHEDWVLDTDATTESTANDTDKPIAGADPILVPNGGETDNHDNEKRLSVCSISTTDSLTGSINDSHSIVGTTPPLHKSVTSLKSSCSSAHHSNASDAGTLSPVPEDDDDDLMAGSYDYHSAVVSCPTYSAGVDIDELIWPAVMDEVLDFFQSRAEEENLRDKMNGVSWLGKRDVTTSEDA